MTQIIPGVHQLPIPIPRNPLGYTNTYLLQGDGKHILIDAGVNTEEALESMREQLGEIDVDIKDIGQIIITHAHHDHYGLAGRLRELSGAKIALHYIEKDLLTSRYANMEEAMRQNKQWLRSNGMPANGQPRYTFAGRQRFAEPTLPDITLRGGETISNGVFELQVLWTPGHSPGHICLYEQSQKILFGGDHVLPVITPNVSLQSPSGDNPLGTFLNSLNMVKQLEVGLVLPAHEHPFTDLSGRVDEILQHHEKRNSEILQAVKTEPRTAYQISGEITWMPELGGVRFKNLEPWDQRAAVAETLAHLEAMRIGGRLKKAQQDSLIYYRSA
ncbi:MAG: MBL fold metallo-hydrolase [Chloroflexi bacterium]|nr:MBL fold metallo-hydrolase [Chloroflexota bacterium]